MKGASAVTALFVTLLCVGCSDPSSPAGPSSVRADSLPAIQTSDNSCDLRGMRVDEAIGEATRFLDRSMRAGRRVVFLIHGHGTGALRDAIRKEVEASGYAAQMRPGESNEGGDGVTVVWLV